MSELQNLREAINNYVSNRHLSDLDTPKNLAIALSIEASELLEPFQWLFNGTKDELSPDSYENVKHEIGDVLIYLIALSDKLEIDLIQAGIDKMAINNLRIQYP